MSKENVEHDLYVASLPTRMGKGFTADQRKIGENLATVLCLLALQCAVLDIVLVTHCFDSCHGFLIEAKNFFLKVCFEL